MVRKDELTQIHIITGRIRKKNPQSAQLSSRFAVVYLNFISCMQPGADYQYLKVPEATIKWFV